MASAIVVGSVVIGSTLNKWLVFYFGLYGVSCDTYMVSGWFFNREHAKQMTLPGLVAGCEAAG